jgi:FkbM family methyltransferase
MLKAVRNAAASAAAWTLYHAPVLEGPYAYAAHTALGVPGVHTVFRETTDRLVARLSRAHRADRRVAIGSVSPVFDVSSFTVKGRYFARVTYEPGATDAVLTGLGEGDVFVDIGANSGYFTVLAALRVGARGRVFAFEPNPVVRRQLQRHVELNAIADRVTISELALADEDQDDVRLFVSCWPENDGIASLTPAPETLARGGLRADASIPVRVRTFDTWAGSARPPRIDLMKIDVEGAEARVLTGMSATFARLRPRRIICETPLDSDAVRILRDRGYRSSMLDEVPGGIPNLLFE